MYKIILVLAMTLSSAAHAVSYEVIGPCSEKPVYNGTSDLTEAEIKQQSVGKFSLDVFEKNKIPYVGNESGFNSILNTPVGMDAIEVLSDTKMRAHGWCYTVNKVAPDVLAGDYFFHTNEDKVVWFFGYSTYDKGEWIDYCVPSYLVHAPQFCEKRR